MFTIITALTNEDNKIKVILIQYKIQRILMWIAEITKFV